MERIGRYRIEKKLGEGGMGVVYSAHDEQLERPVAIKMIRDGASDARARERFWREARAAARVNHPNVCQLYEIGEEQGALFIAMELLEGESLASRLERGPLALAEAAQIGLAMLAALDALHRRGIVHRDLKPSNVFLTPHGVKLLDFGLARSAAGAGAGTLSETGITQPGTVLGTPRYMAPEQILGHPADHRADVFAAGAVMFEMLSGKAAFGGDTVMQVLHAVTHEQPPALMGSPGIVAVDRTIHRALAKRPEERYASADAMAQDLRAALLLGETGETGETARARSLTRLIVLPFRILRPDPETDFLAISLADAITSSLSGLESLVVRSTITAARFVGETPDLEAIAAGAEVDAVLIGTLLRAGDQLRVNAQLVEAPGGTVVCTHTAQGLLRDIFQLQDDLAARIVEALAIPLTAREHKQLKHDVPASPAAYEYYLRANQLYVESSQWPVARDLYLRCLEEDPRYAPAWARLGRVYRVLSKYGDKDALEDRARAEAAFQRALEINPDLSIAHNLYASLEAELGRAKDAMARLVKRAAAHRADPELFSGLVLTCRYCGLLEASVAADAQARRLDPAALTSVSFTYHALGDFGRALETADQNPRYNEALALYELGREDEALRIVREMETTNIHAAARMLATTYRATYTGQREECLAAAEQMDGTGFADPEGWYLLARSLSRLGARGAALDRFERAVEGGFFCYPAFKRDAWLDPLRTDPRFTRILKRAEERHRDAQAAFTAAGGEAVLGMGTR